MVFRESPTTKGTVLPQVRRPRASFRAGSRKYNSRSGIISVTHKMILDHYHRTKNLLVSYSPKALGFF
jgi:hypothetical protein